MSAVVPPVPDSFYPPPFRSEEVGDDEHPFDHDFIVLQDDGMNWTICLFNTHVGKWTVWMDIDMGKHFVEEVPR